MSDKNKFDDEDLEIEYASEEDDDEFEIEFEEDDDMPDGRNDEDGDEFRVDYDYEEFADDSDEKVRLTKNQIINRVMAGLGIAIAGFTIFYGIIAYGMLSGNKNNDDTEQETNVVQEETTEQNDEEFFISKNSDENISDDVKELLKGVKLKSKKTGLSKVDNLSDEIISLTCKDDVSTYDNVRNIYDYMMYYYDVKSTSYVDTDTIYDYCSSMNYVSEYDMELVYRAGKLFKNKSGDSKDYACGFTVLLRNLGLEAYYIDGEMLGEEDEYEEHGYTVVMIDDEMYIFDVAEEDLLSGDNTSSAMSSGELTTDSTEESQTEKVEVESQEEQKNTAKVEYKVFCKTFDELDDKYSDEGVNDSIDSFGGFETLGKLTFTAKVTTDDGVYTSASVNYNNNDNVAVLDKLTIDLYDNVYFEGNVSGSKQNTWKLIVRVYDNDMNYITESTLYNETTDSGSNEVTYRAGRGGYMKLLYVVTDENGRTCTASVTVKVNAPEEETTTLKKQEESSEMETTTFEEETEETTTEKASEEETTTEKRTEETTTEKRTEEETTTSHNSESETTTSVVSKDAE